MSSPVLNGLMTYFCSPLWTFQVRIDAPGGYTREKLKAYKSLEAYNYYQRFVALNGVQWYIHFDLSAVVGSKLSCHSIIGIDDTHCI